MSDEVPSTDEILNGIGRVLVKIEKNTAQTRNAVQWLLLIAAVSIGLALWVGFNVGQDSGSNDPFGLLTLHL